MNKSNPKYVRRRRFCPVDKAYIIANCATNSNGCWLWIGSANSYGYGQAWEASPNRKHIHTHRKAYELWKGQVPSGSFVCHSCDNPRCCNPDHLFLGTAADNSADMKHKNRHRFGDNHHTRKLSSGQVMEILSVPTPVPPTSVGAMAEKFGVSRACIYQILSGKRWCHLQPA